MPQADSINVLVVDDLPANLVALQAVLANVECQLFTARSGLEALRHVLAHEFAVVVLDIHMPEMDGFETARLIRARDRSQSTPIIFMTEYDRGGAGAIEGYRLGAVDYIYTPVDPYVLRSKVIFFVELFRKTMALEQRTLELTTMTADFERSKEHFRALIEDASDLTMIVEENASIRYASPSIERILGYSREQISGRPLVELLHPEDVAALQSEIAVLLKTGVATVATGSRWRHVNGSYRALESTATNLLATPSVEGLVFHARDVTDRNHAEEHVRTLHIEFERTSVEADMRHQALHDGLTGLANRVLLNGRLERAISGSHGSQTQCAVLLLDLDHFKAVNDTLGHQAGDNLLQQVGRRLQVAVRATDLVARVGGDEFAVLLPDTNGTRAAQVAADLLRILQSPFKIGGQLLVVEASIGIAVAPHDGLSAEMVLGVADEAMYQAKRSGMGVAVYVRDQDQHEADPADHLALLSELQQAIDGDEFLLHYQPKVDLRYGTLVGVEALLRWQHPRRGLLLPDEFIPLAEQSGLIYSLSLWVLESVLRQYQVWHATGIEVSVAMNLSERTLHDGRFPDTIARTLARLHVPPLALVLEVTEGSLMADPPRSTDAMSRLRATGVRTCIDHFGIGYSSMAILKSLAVDELKIDRSFIRTMSTDPSCQAIVRGIINLAAALKLQVLADGVDDSATGGVLVGLGCHVVQGALVSPILAAPELDACVAQQGSSWMATVPGLTF